MLYLLSELSGNFGIMLIIIVLLSNQKIFKQMVLKEGMAFKDNLLLALLFGGLGILATYTGVDIKGAIANTREMSIIFGGLLGGPFVGIGAGLIAGVHRYLVNPSGITSLPCSVATVFAGMLSGYLYTKTEYRERWKYGIIAGSLISVLETFAVLLFSRPIETAYEITKAILIPMELINIFGVVILLLVTENIFKEKESLAAKQSETALDIAGRTLPYFLNPDGDAYSKICGIIEEETGAGGVLIGLKGRLLAASREFGDDEHERIAQIVKEAHTDSGADKVFQVNGLDKTYPGFAFKTLAVAPIWIKNKMIGELVILYRRNQVLGHTEKILFSRLSEILSTQFELVKIEKLKMEASRSEIKALQMQINPHFLFNSLNTVVSHVRTDPEKARDLIVNLSEFLRYNTDSSLKLIDINEEIGHVKSYVHIEQARFGERISIDYDIAEDLDVKIPMLMIQPLVENSIQHGMKDNLDSEENRKIRMMISVSKDQSDSVKVSVEDDGVGISEEVIARFYSRTLGEEHVGMSNVHNRLKLIYGSGLVIEKLEKGTRVSFQISERKSEEFTRMGVKYELFDH